MPIPTSTKSSSEQQQQQQQQDTTTTSTTQQQHVGNPSAAATGAGVDTGAGITRDKTQAELDADRLYEEAMEDEYAKRDGGA